MEWLRPEDLYCSLNNQNIYLKIMKESFLFLNKKWESEY